MFFVVARPPLIRTERGITMKWIIITIIVLIALMDYALLVACSHMERREEWMYEQWRKEHKDERHDI